MQGNYYFRRILKIFNDHPVDILWHGPYKILYLYFGVVFPIGVPDNVHLFCWFKHPHRDHPIKGRWIVSILGEKTGLAGLAVNFVFVGVTSVSHNVKTLFFWVCHGLNPPGGIGVIVV
jgi:hypothetical protein